MYNLSKSGMARVTSTGLALMMSFGAAANNSVELTDGVIIDTTQGQVYLMSPERAVEAVSTDSGETLWSNPDAGKPLVKQGNLVVCQSEDAAMPGNLDLVLLDAEQNGMTKSSSTVELPAGMQAGIDNGINSRFSSRVVTVATDAYVSWEYQTFPRQGMIMMQDEDEDPRDSAPSVAPAPSSGTIKLDLSSGTASEVDAADLPRGAVAAFSPAAPTAGTLDPFERLSADARHTLKSERIGDDRNLLKKYRWTIVDNETGDSIGEMFSHLSQSPFLVQGGDTIIYESGAFMWRGESGIVSEPRKIRAYNFTTGTETWNRPVRETAYRGEFPP
jgi:hypothetical protein